MSILLVLLVACTGPAPLDDTAGGDTAETGDTAPVGVDMACLRMQYDTSEPENPYVWSAVLYGVAISTEDGDALADGRYVEADAYQTRYDDDGTPDDGWIPADVFFYNVLTADGGLIAVVADDNPEISACRLTLF